ncbi:uncharacterized protein BDCG_16957 [Blastomyces dermatitidis ER-3]|uniref:Uncharacterized protein n=1 Tax=Ajellomyces dermatitidis (strain ER-3 / ATCC MYA-2586) TaxID=559297 RepID=A0ABX2VVL8_AJEDR|nr:uncharacterized protein BDCG_16957 [Blastomyces dermatitidis ER-3]OAT01193.1 hypothetical protein BDCG_16957 [Blastomyces dermatitidis ER-3]
MDEASTAPAPAHQPSQPPDDGHGHSPSLETARQAKRSSLPARPNVASRHSKRLTLNFPITVSPSIGLSQTQSDQFSPASSVMSPATQKFPHFLP